MTDRIFKVVPRPLWAEAENTHVFRGAPIDVRDGFLHFSTANQLRETVATYFAGQTDLLLVTVDPRPFGEALRWEASRGGDLFPHLYGDLPLDAVLSVSELPLGSDGTHIFPDEVASRFGHDA